MNIPQSQFEVPGILGVLLTEKDLAARLGITLSCVQRWRLVGDGPRFVKVGRLVRYRESDILEWLAARTCANTSQGNAQ